ncbi:MAG TPA: hypothetical protein RMH99_32005, partial [Sandaracinaceae bacterium LLY-WYZ-13_1]|nr:hypothetical protein [Sandaracinaceae bacterium LLY-WYZ-13_1]
MWWLVCGGMAIGAFLIGMRVGRARALKRLQPIVARDYRERFDTILDYACGNIDLKASQEQWVAGEENPGRSRLALAVLLLVSREWVTYVRA